MPIMLEGLDEIPWATMQAVYGNAEKVPGWIRELASDDPDVRQKALRELDHNLLHQGGISEPTIYAIPFFIELLDHPQMKDKNELLDFLAQIGWGGRFGTPIHLFSWRHLPQWLDEWEQKQALDDKPGYDTEAQKALWKGYSTYLGFLEDKDPAICQTVVELLVSFRGEIDTVLPILLSRLQVETDTVKKANLIWLLYGLLPRKHPDSKEYLRPYLDLNQPLLIRFETALAFAEIEREALSQEIWDILVLVFQDPSKIGTESRAVDIAGMFPYVGRKRSKPLLSRLWRYLQTANSYTLQYLTKAALFLAFGDPPPPPRADLSEEQFVTLRMIVGEGEVAEKRRLNGNISVELKLFGFPEGMKTVYDYLAVEK